MKIWLAYDWLLLHAVTLPEKLLQLLLQKALRLHREGIHALCGPAAEAVQRTGFGW